MSGPQDAYYFGTTGGGGYGDPLERDPQRVAEDVKEGYVSLEKAKSLYGVVIDSPSPQVDRKATEAWRDEIRKQRRSLKG